jgi:hypothetical protein
MTYAIVEKRDHLALHGLFDSKERAERHLTVVIPVYVARSYFMDKTLTPDDFEVIEYRRFA